MLTCKLKCSHYAVSQASANKHEFACALLRGDTDGQLMASGAKAYPHGGGWWTISGYAADGSDTVATVRIIQAHTVGSWMPSRKLPLYRFVGEE
jgi:hypothetical protein